MSEILEETIESAEQGNIRESGRTACKNPSNIKLPQRRFDTAIDLSSCPVGRIGIWHSHPTVKGVREPVHSLPDWANILYADVDASVVVGTQSSEVVVAASDQDAARREFENAIGMEVAAPRDVHAAITNGQIPNPTEARRRVRSQLSPLVWRQHTSFPDLDGRVDGLSIPARDAISACSTFEKDTGHPADDGRRSMRLHRRAREGKVVVRETADGIDVKQLAVATVIGNVIGTVTDRVLFG